MCADCVEGRGRVRRESREDCCVEWFGMFLVMEREDF